MNRLIFLCVLRNEGSLSSSRHRVRKLPCDCQFEQYKENACESVRVYSFQLASTLCTQLLLLTGISMKNSSSTQKCSSLRVQLLTRQGDLPTKKLKRASCFLSTRATEIKPRDIQTFIALQGLTTLNDIFRNESLLSCII